MRNHLYRLYISFPFQVWVYLFFKRLHMVLLPTSAIPFFKISEPLYWFTDQFMQSSLFQWRNHKLSSPPFCIYDWKQLFVVHFISSSLTSSSWETKSFTLFISKDKISASRNISSLDAFPVENAFSISWYVILYGIIKLLSVLYNSDTCLSNIFISWRTFL